MTPERIINPGTFIQDKTITNTKRILPTYIRRSTIAVPAIGTTKILYFSDIPTLWQPSPNEMTGDMKTGVQFPVTKLELLI
jgi:hypothetical protein